MLTVTFICGLYAGKSILWEARKARLVAENSPEWYSWESFRAWCIATFAVHDREKHALTQLMNLRRTGTVAEYKADHDVHAAQTDLPMMQHLIYWGQGLKPESRAECKLERVTHIDYVDMPSLNLLRLPLTPV